MRWRNRSGSENVEDRRGQRSGGRGMPMRGGGIVLFLVVIVAGYYGLDLTPLLSDGGGTVISTQMGGGGQSTLDPGVEEDMARFASVALKTTEDTWSTLFRQMGGNYTAPRMVLYTGGTETGCGFGESAMGPFYCPQDETVYLDVSFYQEMRDRLGGGGDFAQGYVLAHEVGHHVQHLLGIDQKVRELQARSSEADANLLSVRLELQADCYAGVWGRMMQSEGILDTGDLEQALRTAEAIGDDRLQRQSTGRVRPDSFTHGTSAQRYYWFKRGFDSGDPRQCDTFADPR